MADDINVQIIADFPEKDGTPAFRDAIYVPMSEFRAMSVSQVEALKQERYDNWKQHLADAQAAADAAPPVPAVSSVEQAVQILRDALAAVEALPLDAETPAPEV